MVVKYVNNLGEEISLNEGNIKLRKTDFFHYEWQKENEKHVKKEREYNLQIEVLGNKKEKQETLNRLFEITEKDIIANKYGRIYFGEEYLSCNIAEASAYPSESPVGIIKEIIVYTEYPYWISEKMYSFFKSGTGKEADHNFLDFPFDFPYDYAATQSGTGNILNEHYTDAEFKMTIYGPCSAPSILIGDHVYQFFVGLEQGEYLKVSSKERLITKINREGKEINEFNSRAKNESVFEKIKKGNSAVSWNGQFGFDISLICERSQPKWK